MGTCRMAPDSDPTAVVDLTTRTDPWSKRKRLRGEDDSTSAKVTPATDFQQRSSGRGLGMVASLSRRQMLCRVQANERTLPP